MVFDHTHPGFPPDIIFSSEDELIEFEPNIDQLEACSIIIVPSLSHFLTVCPSLSLPPSLFLPLSLPLSLPASQVFSEWSLRNTDCLSQLLVGLLVQYREHHKALLSQYQRLHFELQSLLQSGEYSDVNVHCSRPEEVGHYQYMYTVSNPRMHVHTVPSCI